MKTIAQQLNIKDFPFRIKDKRGNQIYYEDSNGCWDKKEYDSDGNAIYHEDSTAFWTKYEYDSLGIAIYCEDSDGVIIDKRPKPDTMHGEDWDKLAYGLIGKKVYHINSDAETKPDDVITLNGIKYKRIDD